MFTKLSSSAMLNLGSLASFAAFPLLYFAAFGGGTGLLVFGGALMALSMISPFLALGCKG